MSKPIRDHECIVAGHNIRQILDANNMTYEDLSIILDNKISGSKLSKYITGAVKFKKEDIEMIADKLLISYEALTKHDLRKDPKYAKNAKANIKNANLLNCFNNEQYYRYLIFNYYSFPLVNDYHSKKSHFFKKTFDFILGKTTFTSDRTFKRIVNGFYKSIDEGAGDAAYVNICSCLGRFYFFKVFNMPPEDIKKTLTAITPKGQIDAFDQVYKLINNENRNEIIVTFLQQYDEIIEDCFEHLKRSKKYHSFLEFFYAIRYYYGILDLDGNKLTYNQSSTIGLHIMNMLYELDNKYAINFINSLQKIIL